MPLTTQVKLLRVLETKEFMRIGSETVTKVDVRIIAASNKDLEREVNAKRFRKDLFFRLKAVTLNIPPLRERKEDISTLIFYFLKQYCAANNMREPKITNRAFELLTDYSWPGNIRELKNAVETASALNRSDELDLADFSPLLSQHNEVIENRNLPVHLNRPPESVDREMIYRALIEIKKDLIELKDLALRNQKFNGGEDKDETEEVISLDRLEEKAIRNALNYAKWNKRTAAQLLNISERTLYRKIKEYEIQ
jgi:DNA-binding NtrC family response regulator